jgi:hypothetical protein
LQEACQDVRDAINVCRASPRSRHDDGRQQNKASLATLIALTATTTAAVATEAKYECSGGTHPTLTRGGKSETCHTK